jgi:hypothetical protein
MLVGYFAAPFAYVAAFDTQIFGGTVTAQELIKSWATVRGSAFLQNLYQSGNISFASFSKQFNRTTNSMTAFMRENGG